MSGRSFSSGQPHFADEAGRADQQDVLASEGFAHPQRRSIGARIEKHHRLPNFAIRTVGRLDRLVEQRRIFFKSKHGD